MINHCATWDKLNGTVLPEGTRFSDQALSASTTQFTTATTQACEREDEYQQRCKLAEHLLSSSGSAETQQSDMFGVVLYTEFPSWPLWRSWPTAIISEFPFWLLAAFYCIPNPLGWSRSFTPIRPSPRLFSRHRYLAANSSSAA